MVPEVNGERTKLTLYRSDGPVSTRLMNTILIRRPTENIIINYHSRDEFASSDCMSYSHKLGLVTTCYVAPSCFV